MTVDEVLADITLAAGSYSKPITVNRTASNTLTIVSTGSYKGIRIAVAIILFPIGLLALVGPNARYPATGVVVVKDAGNGRLTIETSGALPPVISSRVVQLNASLAGNPPA